MKSLLLVSFIVFCSGLLAEKEIGFTGDQFISNGLGFNSTDVEVVADGQVLVVGSTTLFKLYSDSSIAANRTLSLQKPTNNNHLLVLNFEDEAADKIRILDNSSVDGSLGSVKLNGIWTPNAGDTLTLIYSDPDYLEVARSNN
jgi:hypothetical protein